MTDKEKLVKVGYALDQIECDCEWVTVSGQRLRYAVCCPICDSDLIAEYGNEETHSGYIDLSKWPEEGRTRLVKRINEFNKEFLHVHV